jgi:hypothetical protein
MTPSMQRAHFHNYLTQLRNTLLSPSVGCEGIASEIGFVLQDFDKIYPDPATLTAKVVSVSNAEGSTVVLLDNGELWGLYQGHWEKIPAPPPCVPEGEPGVHHHISALRKALSDVRDLARSLNWCGQQDVDPRAVMRDLETLVANAFRESTEK